MTTGFPLAGVRAALVVAAVLSAAGATAGCGRRGAPETPASAAAVLATDEEGAIVKDAAPKAPDRRFILDPLLD